MQKAIFLDRDGVINHDFGYVHRWNNFKIYDDILELLKSARKNKFMPIILTNQSGIARGYFSERQFHKVMGQFNGFLNSLDIPAISYFYCPHSPDAAMKCDCRKPNIGLIKEAQSKFNISLQNSILVGDRVSDVDAGINSGIPELYFIDRHGLGAKVAGAKTIKSLSEIKLF